ncbi:MAG: hypothetical protein AB7V50_07610 [Vampirovibrionia bacterium]
MAISIMASGNTSIAASSPGTAATKEVTVSGMTSSNQVLVTLSHTATQTGQRNAFEQYTYDVTKGSGSFTVTMNQKQTPILYFDYAVLTGTA